MDRSIAPNYSQAQDLKLIFPEKIELHNGAVLYWMKDVKDESVKLDIEWEAGTKYQQKKLVASFTNRMLLSGSETYTAKQIAEEVDFFGGYTQTDIDKDHAAVIVYGLTENIQAIFDVFKKAFDAVAFPETEIDKERDISLNKYKVEIKKVKVLARRAFNKQLFGHDSAYGQVAEEEDFLALSREDLSSYFEEKYQTAPVMFLTGNVDPSFIESIKEWTKRFRVAEKPDFSQVFSSASGRINVVKEDAMQAAIRVGRLMFDKNHPDYFKFQLLNTILGGYFGSRLMANIREDKGYTYGIGSGMAVLQDAGYFFIATEVGSEVKEDALKEVYHEFDKLRNTPVSEEELTKVKNYMLGEFLRQADGPIALMEVYKNIYFNALPLTYYSDFIQAIHSATAEELQELANKYLVDSEMIEVVAG